MVKANPMELPKRRGAGGSDLRDGADAARHRNPMEGKTLPSATRPKRSPGKEKVGIYTLVVC